MADLELPDGARQFPSTQWSDLLQLTDPAHPRYLETLNALIAQYWKPAYHYVRALRDVQQAEAMDLTQQFFTNLLDRNDFARLDPQRGSFRGFLKTSLRNFLVSDDRKKAARRPKGGARLFDFDPADVEWMQSAGPTIEEEPEQAFDRAWAKLILTEALVELERRLADKGKQLYFELFKAYCVDPTGGDFVDGEASLATPTYGELAEQHGVNEDAVRNYLRYARRQLRDIIRRRVKDYLDGDADVESELRFILS